ncbi:terpene synthase family protein [Chryseobacterium lathyri]|uniref:Terpene synthase n=1 Tax=Chryseobacterium lathyri TaxID=395933 RepID=A0A511YFS6_9FLAO|nr:terpene synthase family protein [Chryseobacterium lathyri]GEN74055.1 hypothetical protein CLA01_41270 [Chryseobacterium lathyri]
MNKLIIPKPTYPWPTIQSPIADSFADEVLSWYDKDYTFTSQEAVKRYKKQNMSQVATYMQPTTINIDHMRPLVRFVMYITIFDDYFELAPLHELRSVRDRIFEVMMGDDPNPNEIGLYRQMAAARKEWLLQGMPQFWIERISTNFYDYITYGVMEETPFKLAKTRIYPSLAHYFVIRKYSIGMMPYGDLIDPGLNFALPVHIYQHPIIQRLMQLLCFLITIQNDLASLPKEMVRQSEMMNIVFVLQNEYKISIEEALAETMRIHDEFVAEMDSLHASLPDFSPYQKETCNYVYHIKLMASGCQNWYDNAGSTRYKTQGFIIPQYGKEEEEL